MGSNFVGQHFWARGYFVNTVGHDEEAIRNYIRTQRIGGSQLSCRGRSWRPDAQLSLLIDN
jgi:putative transposase